MSTVWTQVALQGIHAPRQHFPKKKAEAKRKNVFTTQVVLQDYTTSLGCNCYQSNIQLLL